MKDNFDAALREVLIHEGGWSDHPADPGGATMRGITLETYRRFKGNRHLGKDALRAMTDAELRTIYRTMYWDRIRGDELPAGVDYVVFDAAVNSGPPRASKWLQETVGTTPDGVIGSRTLAAVNAMDPHELIERYNETRLAFLRSLMTWDVFGRGWGRRVASVSKVAPTMLA